MVILATKGSEKTVRIRVICAQVSALKSKIAGHQAFSGVSDLAYRPCRRSAETLTIRNPLSQCSL